MRKVNNIGSAPIENIGYLSEEGLKELPYWETINRYLKEVKPEELQNAVCELTRGLIRSRAFEGDGIGNRFWRILIDGSGIVSSRTELDENCIFKVYDR